MRSALHGHRRRRLRWRVRESPYRLRSGLPGSSRQTRLNSRIAALAAFNVGNVSAVIGSQGIHAPATVSARSTRQPAGSLIARAAVSAVKRFPYVVSRAHSRNATVTLASLRSNLTAMRSESITFTGNGDQLVLARR